MSWDNLSMKDKANYMRLAVNHGMTDLGEIRSFYNSYDEWKNRINDYKGLDIDNDPSYDYEGFYNNNPVRAWNMLNEDSDAHFIDKYKTSMHPTFSDESMYSGYRNKYNPEGIQGGTWLDDNYRLSEDQFNREVDTDAILEYLRNNETSKVNLLNYDDSYILPSVDVTYKKAFGGRINKFDKGGNTKKVPEAIHYKLPELPVGPGTTEEDIKNFINGTIGVNINQHPIYKDETYVVNTKDGRRISTPKDREDEYNNYGTVTFAEVDKNGNLVRNRNDVFNNPQDFGYGDGYSPTDSDKGQFGGNEKRNGNFIGGAESTDTNTPDYGDEDNLRFTNYKKDLDKGVRSTVDVPGNYGSGQNIVYYGGAGNSPNGVPYGSYNGTLNGNAKPTIDNRKIYGIPEEELYSYDYNYPFGNYSVEVPNYITFNSPDIEDLYKNLSIFTNPFIDDSKIPDGTEDSLFPFSFSNPLADVEADILKSLMKAPKKTPNYYSIVDNIREAPELFTKAMDNNPYLGNDPRFTKTDQVFTPVYSSDYFNNKKSEGGFLNKNFYDGSNPNGQMMITKDTPLPEGWQWKPASEVSGFKKVVDPNTGKEMSDYDNILVDGNGNKVTLQQWNDYAKSTQVADGPMYNTNNGQKGINYLEGSIDDIQTNAFEDPLFGKGRVRGVHDLLTKNPYALDNWRAEKTVPDALSRMDYIGKIFAPIDIAFNPRKYAYAAMTGMYDDSNFVKERKPHEIVGAALFANEYNDRRYSNDRDLPSLYIYGNDLGKFEEAEDLQSVGYDYTDYLKKIGRNPKNIKTYKGNIPVDVTLPAHLREQLIEYINSQDNKHYGTVINPEENKEFEDYDGDDVAGFLQKLALDNNGNPVIVNSDLWDFEPNGYNKQYGVKLQAAALDHIGTPFILKDVRPINFIDSEDFNNMWGSDELNSISRRIAEDLKYSK